MYLVGIPRTFHRVRTMRHRARTTRGDLLARSDRGIKLNKRLIRIFSLDMCFFLSFKCAL